jgi:hemerythrin-like domain-containing protein
MPSAFEVLAKDHAEVKRMLTELELGPTAATRADADQLALRKKMVQQLVIEESKHEAVEEMYFWQLARFIQAGRAHIAFEETTVWPSLRDNLTAAEAEDLGRKLEDGKVNAPTRPHPKTPASPGVLKTAGPVIAAADRLRDAVTGRDE